MTTTTRDERDAKVREAHDILAAGVKNLLGSEQWMQWMDFAASMSRHHRYSFNNMMLIWIQRPTATHCASYTQWGKDKRQVMKGERGLSIFAPIIIKTTPEERARNPHLGATKLVGFKVVKTFDISQTDGPDVPTPPAAPKEKDGDAPRWLFDQMVQIASDNGFTVEFKDIPQTDGGLMSHYEKKIWIQRGMTQARTVKALFHEVAHMFLHGPSVDGEGNPVPPPACRAEAEVEAESVSFILAKYYEIVPDCEFALSYVAGWASRDPEAVTRSGNRVMQTVNKILKVTDPEAK